eukprot:13074846-Alexandrium_andersonii.AAC.1
MHYSASSDVSIKASSALCQNAPAEYARGPMFSPAPQHGDSRSPPQSAQRRVMSREHSVPHRARRAQPFFGHHGSSAYRQAFRPRSFHLYSVQGARSPADRQQAPALQISWCPPVGTSRSVARRAHCAPEDTTTHAGH